MSSFESVDIDIDVAIRDLLKEDFLPSRKTGESMLYDKVNVDLRTIKIRFELLMVNIFLISLYLQASTLIVILS